MHLQMTLDLGSEVSFPSRFLKKSL